MKTLFLLPFLFLALAVVLLAADQPTNTQFSEPCAAGRMQRRQRVACSALPFRSGISC